MKTIYRHLLRPIVSTLILFVSLSQLGIIYAQSFSSSFLQGITLSQPTCLQFGPDGRLYVTQQNGLIHAYTILRNGINDYQVIDTETIPLIQSIQNHNDNGTVHATQQRQVTGLLVAGTAEFPVLYVGSSDYRIGGGSNGDINLDTNSGVISRLTWNGSIWVKVDLVRGLPRSEENHANNGMQLDESTNILYVASGGNTNAGAPSNNFGFITEYALAAAILAIDLDVLEVMPIYTDQRTGEKFIYDLATLNDPTRADIDNTHAAFPYPSNHPLYNSTVDLGDPFGGNDGLNQAKWVVGSPVQIFATGFRNIYDLLLTADGRLYTWDNGANGNWGGHPHQEGGGDATNNWLAGSSTSGPMPAGWVGEDGIVDGNVNNKDGIHFVGHVTDYNPFNPNANPADAYYGGHPNPIRANPAGAGLFTHDHASGGNNGTAGGKWRTAVTGNTTTTLPVDWPPVPVSKANPVEGDFQNAGVHDNSFWAFPSQQSFSTNGLAMYTASNFNGAKQGHLLAASFNHKIIEIILNAQGVIDNPALPINQNPDVNLFAENLSSTPLDVIAQGDSDPFPGTVWVASYVGNQLTIFEPQDFLTCYQPGDAEYEPAADYDQDGYSNADEVQNDTDHCNGASIPSDADGDFVSDLLDTDDDNDGVGDVNDYFALDAANGLTTHLPLAYPMLNGDPGTGIAGLGFTGLMSNGDDYLNLIQDKDNSEVIILYGGAPGQLGIGGPPGDGITTGDAYGNLNTQQNAFQFGVNVNATTPPFTVSSGLVGPLFNTTPQDFQSAGMFIGTGDQSNYIKIVANAHGGQGGILVVAESNNNPTDFQYAVPAIVNAEYFTLYLTVHPQAGTVQAKYSIEGGAVTSLGNPVAVSGALLTAIQGAPALAVGVISTSRGSSSQFAASWDFINIDFEPVTSVGEWMVVNQSNTPTERHENSYVQAGNKFYLIGGRDSETKKVNIYNPQTQSWTASSSNHPLALHHAQAVAYEGLIYVMGAMTGNGNSETPVDKIYIYNPATDSWHVGADIPRPRAGGGVVVYNSKIYMVGGLQDGHKGGYVVWFDEYDPKTGIWKTLPNMPRYRDHFHAALVGDKLVAAGGRLSDANGNLHTEGHPAALLPENIPPTTNTQNVLVSKVDVFDFTTGQWVTTSIPNIPTPRAGVAVGVIGNEAIVIGGEINANSTRNETEAYDVVQNSWRALDDLLEEGNFVGRHGTQAITNNGGIYVAAGAGTRGGSNELNSQQAFYMFGQTTPSGNPITASTLTASPTVVNFGQVQSGQSVTKSVSLSNENGNQGVEILGVSLSGSSDYSIVTSAIPRLIKPGESVNINIKVSPTASGIITANLLIAHTGANGNLNVSLTTNDPNTPPVADAGADQSLTDNDGDGSEEVTLDGSGSSDVDGTIISYAWSEGEDSIASGVNPVVSLPVGTHTITLTVTDDDNATDTGQVVITVDPFIPDNQSPTADAGADQSLTDNDGDGSEEVTLDGSGSSDVDGTIISYAWSEGEDSIASGVNPVVNLPVGTHTITLTVTDDDNATDTGQVAIAIDSASSGNAAPEIENAIADVHVDMNSAPMNIALSGVFSDAEDAFSALVLTANSSNTSVVSTTINSGTLTLTFVSDATGTSNVTVRATDTGGEFVEDVFTVNVTDPNVNVDEVLYRVNAGGASLSGTPTWEADEEEDPSPYRIGGTRGISSDSIILNSSVPSGVPANLFKTERYWKSEDTAMVWSFPVEECNQVEVRVYLAETHFQAVGQRVFDILVDGVVVDNDVDVYALVGHDVGMMRSYVVVSDGMVDISFGRVVENPAIKGIEILREGISDSCITAIDDFSKRTFQDIKVYPNPFTEQLIVEFSEAPNVYEFEYRVVSVTGVEMIVIPQKIDQNLMILNLKELKLGVGMYLLRIENVVSNETITKRIIKN